MEGLVSDEEFHEAREEISSTSSSESADGETGRHLPSVPSSARNAAAANGKDRPPLWPSSSSYLNSKFQVWKDDPGSIHDRRQRFFKRMGIRNLRESESGHGSGLAAESSSAPGGERKSTSIGRLAAATDASQENDKCPTCGGELGREAVSKYDCLWTLSSSEVQRSGEVGMGMVGSSSANGLKNLAQPGRIGVGSLPEFGMPGMDRLADVGGAVLRGGRSRSGPLPSKSRSSHQTIPATRSATLACSCDLQVRWGAESLAEGILNTPESSPNHGEVVSRGPASQGSSSSPFGEGSGAWNDEAHSQSAYEPLTSSSGDDYVEILEHCSRDDKVQSTSRDGTLLLTESMKEAGYTIRDLDSGKEFVVNELGDGTWNRLREVDTGKELTLEEFESSLGLSPVIQELRRREREAEGHSGNNQAGPDLNTRPRVMFNKKNWLKNIKGTLLVRGSKKNSADGVLSRSGRGYQSCDDTEGSSKGGHSKDGSSKGGRSREPSFMGGRDKEGSSRGRRSGSATDENSDTAAPAWRKPQRIKVRLRRKSYKELSELHMGQEIQAHQGAIWTMKFSPDGRYLASAGQDRVVHVWEILDHPSTAEPGAYKVAQNNGSSEIGLQPGLIHASEGRKTGRPALGKRKSGNLDNKGPLPKLFWLSEKAMCSFCGHTEDVLDLSWSRTQFLLSSSMDKTVRLWHISYEECLRIFSHNDYVTCIEFNPVDDRYFLSGALDDKVRIWSIPDHQVVDWSDLREMVTAVCYTPDGKRAIVGSYKGTCRFYNTAGNKLQLDGNIDVRSDRNKKARGKKITGLHCMPGYPSKVLVTSNDSRIRVYDGLDLHAKYKGLRNVNSQISASFSPNGNFIVSASEDSRVFVWSSGISSAPSTKSGYRKDKQQSCEDFYSRHVSVAIPWPGGAPRSSLSVQGSETPGRSAGSGSDGVDSPSREQNHAGRDSENGSPEENLSVLPSTYAASVLGRSPLGLFGSGRMAEASGGDEIASAEQGDKGYSGRPEASLMDATEEPSVSSPALSNCHDSPPHLQRCPSFFPDSGPKGSATWPEEKLPSFGSRSGSGSGFARTLSEGSNVSGCIDTEGSARGDTPAVSAGWGMVIVTASLGGEITTFQNYGLPIRY